MTRRGLLGALLGAAAAPKVAPVVTPKTYRFRLSREVLDSKAYARWAATQKAWQTGA